MTETIHAGRHLAEGYAAGVQEAGSEWLTVWGSAYDSRLVFPTAGEAEGRAEQIRAKQGAELEAKYPTVVRRVRRCSHPGVTLGDAYSVIEN